jgi:hypothetical protein
MAVEYALHFVAPHNKPPLGRLQTLGRLVCCGARQPKYILAWASMYLGISARRKRKAVCFASSINFTHLWNGRQLRIRN